MTTETLRWAEDVAVIPVEEATVAARLPDGPVWVFEDTAAVLAVEIGHHRDLDALVAWACDSFVGDDDTIRAGIDDFVGVLRELGLLGP